MKASLGVEAVHQRIYPSLYISERSGSKGNAAALNPSSERNFAYLFTPLWPKKCAQRNCKAPCLPASLPLQSGFDRDLGWLHWQGTYRVTQIYLQHSSISPHTRCCWLGKTVLWMATERTIIRSRRRHKPLSALNLTFSLELIHVSWRFLHLCCIHSTYRCVGNHAEKISANSWISNCTDSMHKYKTRKCSGNVLYLRFEGVLYRCGHFDIVW